MEKQKLWQDIMIPLLAATISWFASRLWDRYINVKPRLQYQVSPGSSFAQHPSNGDMIYSWVVRVKVKNNSEHVAFNLAFEVPKKEKTKIYLVKDIHFDDKQIHLEPHQSIDMEVSISVRVSAQNLYEYRIEDDRIIFNLNKRKISNPKETLRPRSIDDVIFWVNYENKSGVKFQSFFQRKNKLDKQWIKLKILQSIGWNPLDKI